MNEQPQKPNLSKTYSNNQLLNTPSRFRAGGQLFTAPHAENSLEMSNLKNQIYQTHILTVNSVTHPLGSEKVVAIITPPTHWQ